MTAGILNIKETIFPAPTPKTIPAIPPNSLKNTAHLGKGEWAVIESDESDGSFLKLPITYSIVTNVDKEHLDYYQSFNRLKNSFRSFIEKTPSFGKSLICLDNDNLKSLLYKCRTSNFFTYNLLYILN